MHVDSFKEGEWDRGPWLEILAKLEVLKDGDEITLLETAKMLQEQGQDEDDLGQFYVWLETLNPEENKELWAQIVGEVLTMLSQLADVLDLPIKGELRWLST